MKVAIVALHFAEYAWRLAKALEARGDTVLLIMETRNASSELEKAQLTGLVAGRVVLIEHRPLRDPRVIGNVLRLRRLLQRFGPEVIHIQETLQDHLIFALRWMRRLAPLVLTVHDHVAHSGRDSRSGLRRDVYRRYLRRSADALIVHADTIRDEIQRLEPSFTGRVWSISHGVLGRAAEADLHAEPGNVLFFGRIEAYKGLGVLIEAISRLQSQGVDVRLTVAGRGDDLQRHRAALDHMPGCKVIERFISVEEIPTIFQRASIIALPYLDATQSGVAALAATYGRPVVASRTGGLPEMVRDGVSGILVEPGDAGQLATAIRTLVENAEVAVALADGARRLARTDLSWEAIAERTAAVYLQMTHLRRQYHPILGSAA